MKRLLSRLVHPVAYACAMIMIGILGMVLVGCISDPEPVVKTPVAPCNFPPVPNAEKPNEKIFTPHFGAVTVLDELSKIKATLDRIEKRPRDCDCGRRVFGANQPSGAPSVIWRIDPMNPRQLQYGYESFGAFYVMATAPVP